MNFRKHVAMPLVALALTLPALVQANSVYHPTSGEIGFTEHPDHWQSKKTRAEVVAEVEVARKDGTLALMQRGIYPTIKGTSPARTRAEVVAEVEAARKDGTLALMQRGIYPAVKDASPAKTRQQVIDEMRN
jgi:hypothetical protein